jgi:hypothetical protein
MPTRTKLILATCVLLWGAAAFGETKHPIETRNAALRYWLAFAELQDPPADQATKDLLEKTAAGESPWDEAKLGAIIDKNEDAILMMQRATNLPECDWGLEYDRGPRASIAYAPRARVLARLNTLYGMRLAAKGDWQDAVDTWLSGIRFSQHLAQGGTLIFSLIAKMGLLSNFGALTRAVQSKSLAASETAEIAASVRALPETGFDWSAALGYEETALDISVKEMKQASNPAEYYQQVTGQAATENFSVPSSSDIAAFHKLIDAAEIALRLPPDQARDRLKTLQDSVKTLHSFHQVTTPSLVRINDSRAQIAAARSELLKMLGSH